MDEYRRIRALWPDHLGLARGKYLPISVADEGTRHCISVFALGYDREMTPSPGAYVLEGLPDLRATFDMADVRPCWEDGTGLVVADTYFRDEPVTISPRWALKRAIADWEELGYHPKIGLELEAFIMERDEHGRWVPWNTPAGFVYGTGKAVDPVGVLDAIMRTAEDVGLPVESINSEYDVPQFELTLRYDDALKAVDDVFLFKVMAREVVHQHGLLCTFLGKPLADRGGSGLHLNLSLTDHEGTNALNDADADDGLSEVTHRMIAGLMAHHEGMTALMAPTVNAYKRLRPAQLTGYWANWGYDHRGVAVRVSPDRGKALRLEHRVADGAANPYTAAATALQAARLGVVNELEHEPAETGDCLENVDTERHTPTQLDQALDLLEQDKELSEAIGQDLVDHFLVIKRAEWERFTNAVTDWELDEYLLFH